MLGNVLWDGTREHYGRTMRRFDSFVAFVAGGHTPLFNICCSDLNSTIFHAYHFPMLLFVLLPPIMYQNYEMDTPSLAYK
jgi:hypothetical protein